MNLIKSDPQLARRTHLGGLRPLRSQRAHASVNLRLVRSDRVTAPERGT
jgi:hypothetical protein